MKRLSHIAASLIAVCTYAICASSQEGASPSLKQIFSSSLQQYASEAAPNSETWLKASDRALDTTPRDVSETLPSIVGALQNSNVDVQLGSALVLLGIGRRPDGAKLLGHYYPSIFQMLNLADDRLQAMPILLIGELRPPPSEAVPVLVRFIHQPNRDSKAQAGAVGLLVRIAPQNLQVIAEIKTYLSKPSDPNDRVLTLNALSGLRTDDEQLIAAVVDSLGDPNSGVRFTAVQVVPSMGPNALRQAEPALRKMIANPEETPETQAMAKQALEQVGSQ